LAKNGCNSDAGKAGLGKPDMSRVQKVLLHSAVVSDKWFVVSKNNVLRLFALTSDIEVTTRDAE